MSNPNISQPQEHTDTWTDSTGNRSVDPDTAQRIRDHLEAHPDQALTPPGLPDDEAKAAELRAKGIKNARAALKAATDRVRKEP